MRFGKWVSSLLACQLQVAFVSAAGSSFGGVNHYYLANLPTNQRDAIITTLNNAGARVIRTFVGARPFASEKGNQLASTSPDYENPLGSFDANVLRKYDDLLASVNRISNGKMKVILSLHNANNLGKTDQTCDVYCNALKGQDWGNFYSDPGLRNALKARYRFALNTYKSPNFNGRTWSDLNEVILAINLENEPAVSRPVSFNISGWVKDMASFLKNDCRLNRIAVATGGLRGSENGHSKGDTQGPGWTQEVFDSPDIDIISLHGYYGGQTPDQPWYDLLIQQQYGGVLRQKALNAKKLIMVEEWSFSDGQDKFDDRNGEIWAQSHALNVRGIPWLYWDIIQGPDNYCDSDGCKEVSVDGYGQSGSPFSVLASQFNEAYNSATEFDWSPYFPVNTGAQFLVVPSNGQSYGGGGDGGSCTWGCVGWQCSASSPCQGDNECVSGTCKACSWGCKGWQCSASSPCKGDNECVNGVCKACSWGCKGWACSASSPCKDANECVSGTCKACSWGCKGWNCNANTPCQGQLECTNGVCSSCTWGCRGWNCNAQTPCKSVNKCGGNGVCKPCDWGCPGWSCSASSPCQGDLECKSGTCGSCTWGCLGWQCSASSPCKGQNECVSGTCKPCSWGCRGWSCSASSPCKGIYKCVNGACRA